jgi:hypothetical protein
MTKEKENAADRIATISALASSVTDKDLLEVLSTMEGGDKLHKILINGVDREIQKLVNKDYNDTDVSSVSEALEALTQTSNAVMAQAQVLQSIMTSVMESPLPKLLAILNDNFTKTNLADQLQAMNASIRQGEVHQAQVQAVTQEPVVSQPPKRATKKYADGKRQVQAPAPTPAPQPRAAAPRSDLPAAPILPPRGGGVEGMF